MAADYSTPVVGYWMPAADLLSRMLLMAGYNLKLNDFAMMKLLRNFLVTNCYRNDWDCYYIDRSELQYLFCWLMLIQLVDYYYKVSTADRRAMLAVADSLRLRL